MPSGGDLEQQAVCYLTTKGRISRRDHRIEIWFSIEENMVYLLSGGGSRSDWVRNLIAEPAVVIEIAGQTFTGTARVLEAGSGDDKRARDLVFAKYQPTYGGDLTSWRDSALAIGVDLERTSHSQ